MKKGFHILVLMICAAGLAYLCACGGSGAAAGGNAPA